MLEYFNDARSHESKAWVIFVVEDLQVIPLNNYAFRDNRPNASQKEG